jgi:anti-sigma regulatory factor (Ser/Thr protein kinase)
MDIAGDLIHETQLPPTVEAPSIARRSVRAAGRGLSPRVVEDAQLLVSELVSNVLAYAREPHPIQLRIRTNHVLSLEVEEASQRAEPTSPRRVLGRWAGPSLWGRDLVAALADSWGVIARDGRSSAWAELRLDR